MFFHRVFKASLLLAALSGVWVSLCVHILTASSRHLLAALSGVWVSLCVRILTASSKHLLAALSGVWVRVLTASSRLTS